MFNQIIFNEILFNSNSNSNSNSNNDDFGVIELRDGETIESFLLEEAPLIIHQLDSQALTDESMTPINLITDPYYYHPITHNNFSFFCDYNAPSGEVNLVFPDTPCSAFASFEGFSGSDALVIEIITADLYEYWTGEYSNADLSTYRILSNLVGSSGELSVTSLRGSSIFDLNGFSGQTNQFLSLFIPPFAQCSSDAWSGEEISLIFSVSYGLSSDAWSDEHLNVLLSTTDTLSCYYESGSVLEIIFKPFEYDDYILSEGPSAYWRLNEKTGTSAIDSTGNNSPATYTNGPVLGFTSPIASRSAVYLDGSNDLIIGNPLVLSNDLTQEMWVKPDVGATITLVTASSSGIQGLSGQRFAIFPYNNGLGSGAGLSIGSNGIQVFAHGSSYLPALLSYQHAISTSSYTHVLVSWSNRTPTLYINGQSVGVGFQARSPLQSYGLPYSNSYGCYKGYLQDIAIYPYALTASQASDHYQAGIDLSLVPRFGKIIFSTGQLAELDDLFVDLHANFGFIDYLDGSNLNIDLENNIRLYLNGTSDELNQLELSIHPAIDCGLISITSDEYSTVSLITSSVIDSFIYSGEYSSADLVLNPFDQLEGLGSSGETGESSLYTEYVLYIDGSSGELGSLSLDTHLTIPLGLTAYSGETCSPIILITSSVFSSLLSDGCYGNVTFTTFPGELFLILNYSGGYGSTSLATVNQLNGQAYSDQYSDASLTVFYSSTLVLTGYSDQSTQVTLRTQDSLKPQGSSSQTSLFELLTYPASPISGLGSSGERGDFNLQLGITFPSVMSDGSLGSVLLETMVNPGTILLHYSGEYAQVVDMATTYQLPLVGSSGSSGSIELGLEYAIELSGYSGSMGSVSLTLNPPDLLTINGTSGQSNLPITLSTRTILPNIGISGEYGSLNLTSNPAPSLLFNGYHGQWVTASMQTAIQLPIDRFYTGTRLSCSGMDTVPNWIFPSGSNCEVTLSTTVALSFQFYEGALNSFAFGTRPSEPLGLFTFRLGEWMSPGLEVLYSAQLRVLYRTSIMTQVDIRSATYFDLSTDDCCGERLQSNNLNFMMERGQIPETVSFGDRVSMSLDLRCNPRMKVSFSTGQVAELIDKTAYLNLTFGQESHSLEIDWFADLRHRLCKGYFIPTGDWLVVELKDILPEDCYADRFYGGEKLSCELSDDLVLRVAENPTGEFVIADLVIQPPWIFNAYHGQRMTFDFPFEAKHTEYAGERLFIKFYEPPILGYVGQTVEFEMSTEYGIRFLEDGCFDNEFVYQTSDGDLIPELFNPVPIEGEPYQHDIKAECF